MALLPCIRVRAGTFEDLIRHVSGYGCFSRGSPLHESVRRQVPAFGPIEAVLGYVLFYVLVDRLTPALVTVLADGVVDLSAATIRFVFAAALWFVLVVSAMDQTRRQLAALGLVSEADNRLGLWSRVTPTSLRTAGYLLASVAGSALAAVTFEPAVQALRSFITLLGAGELAAFEAIELVFPTVFVISYSLAGHSLDRLVIGGIRELRAA
jgi:hypothetical protein